MNSSNDVKLRRFSLIIVCIVIVFLLSKFLDATWMHSDEGVHSHVAERVFRGEVLNLDIENFHPGYSDLLNCFSFHLFGQSFLSLRYPVALVTLLQAILIFLVFSRKHLLSAVTASLCVGVIGFLQALTPNPSYYCLFLTIAIIYFLQKPDSNYKFYIVGALLGTIFLFRQLTAVLVTIGVVVFLSVEQRNDPKRCLFSQLVLTVVFLGFAFYIFKTANITTMVLFGTWPLLLIYNSYNKITSDTRRFFAVAKQVVSAFFMAAIPIVIYHIKTNSFKPWLYETLVRSLSVTQLEHTRFSDYVYYILAAFIQLFDFKGVIPGIISFYWLGICFASLVNGYILYHCFSRELSLKNAIHPLPIIAVCYSVVSIFNQIPYFIYQSAGLSLASIIWLLDCTDFEKERFYKLGVNSCLFICIVAITLTAGQPSNGSCLQVLSGEKVVLVPAGLEKSRLRIPPKDAELYKKVIEEIHRLSGPTDAVFSWPCNPEIYFLSERKNPFRFFSPTISLLNDQEVKDFYQLFLKTKPKLLIFDKGNFYKTNFTDLLINEKTSMYKLETEVERFQFYTLK